MGLPEEITARSKIAFFDVETSVPTRPGQKFAILEFGAILVCPRKLEEIESYSTLICPNDLSLISSLSVRRNGITRDTVLSAPSFRDVADKVYDILHTRIWAGHNIIRFDCARIREAFAEIGRAPPEPRGYIDSLVLLSQKFGRRAGDMKESSLPDIFPEKSWVSPNATTRSHSNGKPSPEHLSPSNTKPSSNLEDHPIASLLTHSEGEVSALLDLNAVQPNPFDLSSLRDAVQPAIDMEEKSSAASPELSSTVAASPELSSTVAAYEAGTLHTGFLEPEEVSIPSIVASYVTVFHGIRRMELLHNGVAIQLSCSELKVCFGISTKFVDNAGRPRLSFVVHATPSLSRVLDACDSAAQKQFLESVSTSEWNPVVNKKGGFVNSPTIRLHIPTVVNGDTATYKTEIYHKRVAGTVEKLVFSKFDASELDSLFKPQTIVDACFSLDPYDYDQRAGIRLVAKKLIIHVKA